MPASGTVQPGTNIALKVPAEQYQKTLAFYRDAVGLEQVHGEEGSHAFRFGTMTLWIDKVAEGGTAEVWLELYAKNTAAAAEHLRAAGAQRCDEVEQLPQGFDGFFIRNPAGIVHLVTSQT